MNKVVVIGGGVIGLLNAYELRKRGADVVLLDRETCGAACSSGNAGWIVPSFSEPLAAPGLTWKSLTWLLKPDSPLYIKPSAIPQLAGWLLRFRRHCNRRDFEAGCRALARLNRPTLELFDTLERDGVRFEVDRSGILYAHSTLGEMEHTRESVKVLEACGYPPPEALTSEQIRELEPELQGPLVGGFLFRETLVRPESLCAGVSRCLRELQVDIRERTSVDAVIRHGSRVTGVRTSAGLVEADAFVLAAGAWSGQLAQRFGYALPVQAGKGYSITITNPATKLRHAIMLATPKMGVSPFAGALRVAGTMELSGINLRLDAARVASMTRAVAPYLPRVLEGEGRVDWVGMRPVTPDGLPIIGRLPRTTNAYVATGHAMLGVTLAPSTAHALADLVLDDHSTVDLDPFSPARF